MWSTYLQQIGQGNFKALARCISLIENEVEGYEQLLQGLPPNATPIIGITGPPGAGKSTLTDALIGQLIASGKTVGVLCVDPSSPFHFGALLGDRIRMAGWYNDPRVFIRSLATRGALGGLHPKIIEITELMKAARFDYVVIETVGVGQSEIEIAGLADTTVVVLVPESGDEIQSMKAGLMEIADIFVVNKADRPNADQFARQLQLMLDSTLLQKPSSIAVIKTVASQQLGIDELYSTILAHQTYGGDNERKYGLLAQKAFQLIQQRRMRGIDKNSLKTEIASMGKDFNLYAFVQQKLLKMEPDKNQP